MNYIEWGDESETIVVAKMIAAGERLYSQIFNHHGPLILFQAFCLKNMDHSASPVIAFLLHFFKYLLLYRYIVPP
ncbi:hypothetical protein [Candidatus Skiveiella danica]|uniref:hypothetical protein n=1 Tax=Candidatus Skiveiella danica TaxID=3386177 RepID=UPI0039B9471E